MFQTLLYIPDVPLARNFRNSITVPEYVHNFHLALCESCHLPQLLNPVPAEKLYDSSIYLTGFQKPCHLDDLINSTLAHQPPGKVLEIGCNDGALLTALKEAGYKEVFGIEPNQYAATMATKAGHHVIHSMLTKDIVIDTGIFDTVYCRHVLEHVPNITEFMENVRDVLTDDGIFVLELPIIEGALNQGNPAILWEEHVNYFTIEFTKKLLSYFGFEILEERQYVFGGGSQAYVARKVAQLKTHHKALDHTPLLRIQGRFDNFRQKLKSLLEKARALDYTIVLYGAGGRSASVMNLTKLANYVDAVIDDRAELQGLIFAGTELPVEALNETEFSDPVLFLMGVGAEKEHKARQKIKTTHHLVVSLFPQSDTLASMQKVIALLDKESVIY